MLPEPHTFLFALDEMSGVSSNCRLGEIGLDKMSSTQTANNCKRLTAYMYLSKCLDISQDINKKFARYENAADISRN